MKTTLDTIVSVPLLGLLAGALLTGCASLPNDGATPKTTKFQNVLDQRYLEIFLIAGNGISGNLKAACYNTQSLNGGDRTGDSAPQNLVDKLDVKTMKKENHVLGAFVNGPRRWCLDWIDVPVGVERDFNGLKLNTVYDGYWDLPEGELHYVHFVIDRIEFE